MGCTLPCERRRLAGGALIEREVGLGLLKEVPVRHRLGIIVPGGWVSCADSGERPNQDGSGWYPSGAGQSPQWAQRRGGRARSEVDAAAHREPRGSVRRARPRRCCAMRRLAAPQLGQTSGSDSNSRGLIPPGQHGPERARRRASVRGRCAKEHEGIDQLGFLHRCGHAGCQGPWRQRSTCL